MADPKPVAVLKPTIAVDFDGTLCDFAFPGIGAPKPGAKEALKLFRSLGFRVVIHTCRTSHHHYDIFGGDPSQPTLERDRVKEMIAFLKENGLEYDEIDDGSKGKPLADFYIDDKGVRFDNNWPAIANMVQMYALVSTKRRMVETVRNLCPSCSHGAVPTEISKGDLYHNDGTRCFASETRQKFNLLGSVV